MQSTCKDCHYYLAGGTQGSSRAGTGNCFLKPPVVQFVPVEIPVDTPKMALPSRGAVQEVQSVVRFQPHNAVPLVREIDFCSEHKLRDDKANPRAWEALPERKSH